MSLHDLSPLSHIIISCSHDSHAVLPPSSRCCTYVLTEGVGAGLSLQHLRADPPDGRLATSEEQAYSNVVQSDEIISVQMSI